MTRDNDTGFAVCEEAVRAAPEETITTEPNSTRVGLTPERSSAARSTRSREERGWTAFGPTGRPTSFMYLQDAVRAVSTRVAHKTAVMSGHTPHELSPLLHATRRKPPPGPRHFSWLPEALVYPCFS